MSTAWCQSQSELNGGAVRGFGKNDAELNKVYNKILGDLDPEERVDFRRAGKAWIGYRDAQSDFEAARVKEGSIHTLIYYTMKSRLIMERIKFLQEFGHGYLYNPQ